ncbi:MAG: hypothetical protein U0271_33950 [Polyangiaceae bacterium]
MPTSPARHIVFASILGVFALGCDEPQKPTSRSHTDEVAPSASASVSARTRPRHPPPPTPGFKPTRALVTDEELVRRVDDLATYDAIESSSIGVAGSPSEAYASLEAVVAKATPADLLALAKHESPVVRGYVAGHLAHAQPELVDQLTPLFSDATAVDTQSGCVVEKLTVASVVISALCDGDSPKTPALLREVALTDGVGAPPAIDCLARRSDPSATEVIDAALKSSAAMKPRPTEVRVAALAAFELAPAQKLCGAIRRLSMGTDDLAGSAERALVRCEDAASLATLEREKNLLAVALNPSTTPARRLAILADEQLREAAHYRLYRWLHVRAPDPKLAKVVDVLVNAYPGRFGWATGELPVSDEATALVHRLVTKFGVGSPARSGVLRYFVKLKAPADIHEVEKSLESPNDDEVAVAVEALAAIRGSAARPKLEAMRQRYPNWPVRGALDSALVKI